MREFPFKRISNLIEKRVSLAFGTILVETTDHTYKEADIRSTVLQELPPALSEVLRKLTVFTNKHSHKVRKEAVPISMKYRRTR